MFYILGGILHFLVSCDGMKMWVLLLPIYRTTHLPGFFEGKRGERELRLFGVLRSSRINMYLLPGFQEYMLLGVVE